MLLFWKIRYFDTKDKQFKDRNLWLDTDVLDSVTKSAVEASHELKDLDGSREMLRYRHLFEERNHTEHELRNLCDRHGGMSTVFIYNYFEDETGHQLTSKQMAFSLTGDPGAILLPPGAKQYDIDYIQGDQRPICIDQVGLSDDQLNVLGYFARDLRELLASAFYKDGPGTITAPGRCGNWILETAVNDEEIRSFVTIFRRLHMAKEPANFLKAVAAFRQAIQGYSLAKWVEGIAGEYQKELDQKPDCVPMTSWENLSFSRKRLIDVFLYTQYLHQPNDCRTRQFQECLNSVGGNRPLLTWLFLTEVWKCALQMGNAGTIMAEFYDRYCQCHNITTDVLASVRSGLPGLGPLEKREAREARVLTEKSEELAQAIWENSGRPEGGHTQFMKRALEQLMAATGRTSGGNG